MQMKYRKIVLAGLILLPAILYFFLVLYFAVNIPLADDYDVVLNYLNSSSTQRHVLLFTQHLEHRLVFIRLVAEAMYHLLGRIDFRYLIYIGNSALFLIFFVLLYLFKKTGISIGFFLPVPYILFCLLSWGNMTWAVGSMMNYYVLLFSMLALLFFQKRKHFSFLLAMVFATVAAFTSGSGLFIFIVMVLWSILKVLERPVDYGGNKNPISSSSKYYIIRSIVVFAVTSIVFYLYFNDYTKPATHPSIIGALLNPMHSLAYFFVLLGSYTQVKIVAFIAGVMSILLFAYLTRKRYYRKNPIVYYFLVFLILNVMAATLTRSGFGITQALDSRYVIISILMLSLLYISVLDTVELSLSLIGKAQYVILILAVIFSALSIIAGVPRLSKRRSLLITGVNSWKASGVGLIYPRQDRATRLLQKALDKGYYQIP